jgi:hypothetical protein
MSFIVSAASNYILNDGLGDWSSLVTTPTNFTGTACLYYSTCLMANISRVLGRSDDADKYDTLAGKRSSSHTHTHTHTHTQRFSLISFFFFVPILSHARQLPCAKHSTRPSWKRALAAT